MSLTQKQIDEVLNEDVTPEQIDKAAKEFVESIHMPDRKSPLDSEEVDRSEDYDPDDDPEDEDYDEERDGDHDEEEEVEITRT